MVPLGNKLMDLAQKAQGNLLSKTQHAVQISDPKTRLEVQESLDHAVNILGIANIMAIFEEHLPKRYWVKVLREPKITKKLRAFRHLRFCANNGFTERRAKENAKDFDAAFLNAGEVAWLAQYDADRIILRTGATQQVYQEVRLAFERAIVAVHNA